MMIRLHKVHRKSWVIRGALEWVRGAHLTGLTLYNCRRIEREKTPALAYSDNFNQGDA